MPSTSLSATDEALDLRDAAALASSRPALLSVVICTLDEHESIERVLAELEPALGGIQHEVIVVDDSLDDLTAVAVRRKPYASPLRLVRRQGARGLSSAAIAGWDAAHGDMLAIMDGDGQHDPRMLRRLLDQMEQDGSDLAVASRYLDSQRSGLNPLRHALSRVGTRLTSLLLGIPLADPLSGCFLMRGDWYKRVRPHLSGLGFKILIDVIASTPERPVVSQLPTELRQRMDGKSKLSPRVALDLLMLLLEKRSHGRWTAARQILLIRCLTAWAAQVAICMALVTVGLAVPWALLLAIVLSLPMAWPRLWLRRPLRPLTWIATILGATLATQHLGLPWRLVPPAGMLFGSLLVMPWADA